MEIHTIGADKTIEIYASMDELEGQLGEDFYRCHRAYIVNMAHITEYNNESITLTNSDRVYLTKKKYSEFVKAYMWFLLRKSLWHSDKSWYGGNAVAPLLPCCCTFH